MALGEMLVHNNNTAWKREQSPKKERFLEPFKLNVLGKDIVLQQRPVNYEDLNTVGYVNNCTSPSVASRKDEIERCGVISTTFC